jgi:hypothetical protein
MPAIAAGEVCAAGTTTSATERSSASPSHRDPDSKPGLRNIERVHRLREVMALVGFTRFEPVGTDEEGELDLEGITPAALSPEAERFRRVFEIEGSIADTVRTP